MCVFLEGWSQVLGKKETFSIITSEQSVEVGTRREGHDILEGNEGKPSEPVRGFFYSNRQLVASPLSTILHMYPLLALKHLKS